MKQIRLRSAHLALCLGIAPGMLAWSQSADRPQPENDISPVQVAMKNVFYHFGPSAAVHIVQLQGTLTPTKSNVVVFDDKNSFRLNLDFAEIAVDSKSLAAVMNENVFSASDSPIKKVTITTRNHQLAIGGRLHSKGDVPFEVNGVLAVNHDGRIRFHAETVKAAHLPIKGLLDLLGINLANLINTRKVQGLSIDKDDLILNPEEIFPPPHIRGRLSAIRLQGTEIVQVFGTARAPTFAASQSGNYMAYRDGGLRFGKLTMNPADLFLIDMDPNDPFDFDLDHYVEQLVEGYTKTTAAFGLRVYTRDYNKLHRSPSLQNR
jgi:hypothetical protein